MMNQFAGFVGEKIVIDIFKLSHMLVGRAFLLHLQPTCIYH